ncbi:bifunctional hydroxymethylpyrimidine kinase/phosphomethylpyrimidine kinase [Staphylococcus cohnii]|uniref:bifunctional hydroxymethylpyrimidine kinase/phosphomethylpyrimidine kinase n=1 Tax=Staphylococcus cohnii species complex TaxID=3239053 RepID=UPI00085C07E8|nr:bifunctional hydroxymethylpyrimidine kinase/phosphomethylpyrimidine kinase [Staphylococcus ureilyticus]PTF45900.1 bifunctional hydroxymethylpyrimidine kinase/phosphomethylpyrimidine kinase [Staphylococcus cohnii]SCT00793.1 phosphomethylpyrimidine kinase [Staphylococcus cohnii subsp. cohnii]PTG42671.1 bifunctional hydroxymethylpyrimidine kinase/phosphomethylpyrimidine kinase [Staphylococcus cohnii]PUZ35448.1 bifunctional hydroxymethylpyrimidine kinase/phosphomethylpyrimidine kinase [Staphyloc
MALKKTLTIAGSDTSAGAGMQADLKTFQELGTYGIVALTSIVTMDKESWSHDVTPIPFDVFEKQLETAISIGPDAVKTGMLGTQEIIKRAGEAYVESGANYFVVDPVMVCKGENEVLNPGNTDAMIEYLLPKATVVTPNLFEAGQLANLGTLKSIDDMKKAADIIHQQGAQHVIIKGGKALDQDKSYDLYYNGENYYQLTTDMFQQSYNHGAGCTFAAATTAYLANGKSPKEAVIAAKAFVASAIKNGWKMNDFVGPVDHGAYNRIEHIDVVVTEV